MKIIFSKRGKEFERKKKKYLGNINCGIGGGGGGKVFIVGDLGLDI